MLDGRRCVLEGASCHLSRDQKRSAVDAGAVEVHPGGEQVTNPWIPKDQQGFADGYVHPVGGLLCLDLRDPYYSHCQRPRIVAARLLLHALDGGPFTSHLPRPKKRDV